MSADLLHFIETDFLRGAAAAETAPLVLFFIFFFATFISEDAACIAAGALAAEERISFAIAIAACFTGIFAGDVLLYWAGRTAGRSVAAKKILSRFATEKAFSKASGWLDRRGAEAVFLSRFLPGLRLPTYLAAGFLRMRFLTFAIYFLLASAVWTPLVIGAAAFSQNFFFSQNLFFGIVFSFVAIRIALHLASWKNRRLFAGRVKRIVKWEFWPLWAFYFPVAVCVLVLAVKYRGLTVFTCANPAIPASGFVGESKNEIYEGLQKSPAAARHLLSYVLLENEIPAAEKLSKASEFISQNTLDFPIVLKPDAGERGKGVKIVRDFPALKTLVENLENDHILQEFAPGVEASVFYFRYPAQKKGRIFSVTEKRFPCVTGDGSSTLEELILDDPRAVCLARSYFRENSARLESVPAAGTRVPIIEIGTHSRGAIFTDGRRLKTAALENKIDEICRGFAGFYFGRFDIRAASFSDLQGAKNFKIIELNGVTSESTNIYDPRYTLFAAYRILTAQWRIAFEIGAENRRRGAKATPVRELVKLLFRRPGR